MTKDKIKYLPDFIPLIILTVYAIMLIWTVATTDIAFSWEHYIGLTLLVTTAGLFSKRHKLGVVLLGMTWMLGVFKLLSYSAIITFHSFGGSINGHSSPEIRIQVIFLLWLLIHFIVSARHYVGVATKKYWKDLLDKAIIETSN